MEIAPKVLGNIERVEQEMNAIDPNLVFMADQEGAPIVRDDGIDPVFTMPETKTMTMEKTPIIETDLPLPINSIILTELKPLLKRPMSCWTAAFLLLLFESNFQKTIHYTDGVDPVGKGFPETLFCRIP